MKTAEHFHRQETPAATWLVLGATGFVGRAVLAELKAHDRRASGAARSTHPEADGSGHVLDLEDIPRLRSLLRQLHPSILINALGHPPAMAESQLREFYVKNAASVLEAVRAEIPECRVVLMGSAAEYGNSPERGGSAEADALRPLTEYGRAKVEQFEVASRFAPGGMSIVTARLFNLIGPGQGNSRFAGALLERMRSGERPARVRCGNYIRDWLDVRDAARALVMLAESSDPSAVVNICSGAGHTVEFAARIVERLAGVPVQVEPGETSPDVLWRSVGNPARMLQLGWRPRHTLAESLADQWRHSL